MYNNKHKIIFGGSDEYGEGEHKILKCENDNIFLSRQYIKK
jgi:hypothetical protein